VPRAADEDGGVGVVVRGVAGDEPVGAKPAGRFGDRPGTLGSELLPGVHQVVVLVPHRVVVQVLDDDEAELVDR
jgi:hypothetical protein